MAAMIWRKAALLFKLETTEGVDAAPVAATDGVLCENISVDFNPNIVNTNEYTPSLDAFDPIVGGMAVPVSFDFYLKGNGTPGTAPEWGKVLKACGFAETITAAAVPAAPEACAAGGSTTTAVLGATAVGTAQLYRGMPVNFTGVVAGSSFIYDYSAGKAAKLTDTESGAIVATTNYQIPVNVLYVPASASISSATLYIYHDGVLYKLVGFRGSASLDLTSGTAGKVTVKGMAMFSAKIDSALPSVNYDPTRPPIWKNGAFTINSVAGALQQVTIDEGAQMVQPDDPNQLEGMGVAVLTKRDMRGTMNPLETLVATRDLMTAFRSQTKQPIHARFGSVAGNRIGVTIPSALYLNQTPQERNGLSAVNVPFDLSGQDSGVAICVY